MRILIVTALVAAGAWVWQPAFDRAVAHLCTWDNPVAQWKAGCL